MPTTTPDIKVKAVRRLGGTVELVGDSYTETQTHAQVQRDPPLLSTGQTPSPCRTRRVRKGSKFLAQSVAVGWEDMLSCVATCWLWPVTQPVLRPAAW